MTKTSEHVVPSLSGRWAVRNSGARRASRIFNTLAEAIKLGRTEGKNAESELYVHGKDGTIKSKNSYGRDAFPPRDKN